MEMKYLRRVMGITRLDTVSNLVALLNIEPLIDKIEQGQLKWFGHLIRMKNDMDVKKVWEAKTQQRRARSRAAKTQNESLEEILKRRGLDVMKTRKIAKDKKKWKEIVYGKTWNVINLTPTDIRIIKISINRNAR